MKKITLSLLSIAALVIISLIYTACKKNDRAAEPKPLITASKIEDLTEQELRMIAEDADVKKFDELTTKASQIIELGFSSGELNIKEVKGLVEKGKLKEVDDLFRNRIPDLIILSGEATSAREKMLKKFPVLNIPPCAACSDMKEKFSFALNAIDNKLNSPAGNNNARICNRSCKWCFAFANYVACLAVCGIGSGTISVSGPVAIAAYGLCAYLCVATYCKWG